MFVFSFWLAKLVSMYLFVRIQEVTVKLIVMLFFKYLYMFKLTSIRVLIDHMRVFVESEVFPWISSSPANAAS